jgi:hypothetical protein
MGAAKRRRVANPNLGRAKLEIVFVGWDDPNDKYPFVYTAGCAAFSHPELIVITTASADKSENDVVREYTCKTLITLVQFAATRGHLFSNGEHLHCDEIGLPFCVEFVDFTEFIQHVDFTEFTRFTEHAELAIHAERALEAFQRPPLAEGVRALQVRAVSMDHGWYKCPSRAIQ